MISKSFYLLDLFNPALKYHNIFIMCRAFNSISIFFLGRISVQIRKGMDSLKENLGSSTCPALWRVETEHPCKAEVADMETDIGHIAS